MAVGLFQTLTFNLCGIKEPRSRSETRQIRNNTSDLRASTGAMRDHRTSSPACVLINKFRIKAQFYISSRDDYARSYLILIARLLHTVYFLPNRVTTSTLPLMEQSWAS